MRPIFLVCLALISVSQAVFRMNKCSETLGLSEYDRQAENGYNVRGYFEHYTAASPYYFAMFAEVATDKTINSLSFSPGSDYLSRNQIPTSDDYRRINPSHFTQTVMIRSDMKTENYAGGPFLTSVDFGDGKTRYMSALANIAADGGRSSLNWAREHEWSEENPCEFFAGSYFNVKCDPLWSFSSGNNVLLGESSDQWETGFGSGNPLTGIHTTPGLSATWTSNLMASAAVEINIYYNLGLNDKLKIFNGIDITTGTNLVDLTGPAVGTMTVKTTAFDFSSTYTTASDEGYGFRAVYNVMDDSWPCFSTGNSTQCNDDCYKAWICSWDGIGMSSSLLQNFNYGSCCTDKWGPECVLAADSVYWLQVCDASLDVPYYSNTHNRDVQAKREEFVANNMPHIDSLSQLQKQRFHFAGPKARSSVKSA